MRSVEFEDAVIEKLSRLQTQMESLVGGDQPGFVQRIDERVSDLERDRNLTAGALRGRKDLWAFALSGLAVLGEIIRFFLYPGSHR